VYEIRGVVSTLDQRSGRYPRVFSGLDQRISECIGSEE